VGQGVERLGPVEGEVRGTSLGTQEYGVVGAGAHGLVGSFQDLADPRVPDDLPDTVIARAAVPDARRGDVGKRVGSDDDRAANLPEAVMTHEEVRPMNDVSRWVLPLFSTVGPVT
jgi:hypothetical protein